MWLSSDSCLREIAVALIAVLDVAAICPVVVAVPLVVVAVCI